jgi:hypothetical protein
MLAYFGIFVVGVVVGFAITLDWGHIGRLLGFGRNRNF